MGRWRVVGLCFELLASICACSHPPEGNRTECSVRTGCAWVDTSVLAGLVHAPLLWKLLPDHGHFVSQEDGSAYS